MTNDADAERAAEAMLAEMTKQSMAEHGDEIAKRTLMNILGLAGKVWVVWDTEKGCPRIVEVDQPIN